MRKVKVRLSEVGLPSVRVNEDGDVHEGDLKTHDLVRDALKYRRSSAGRAAAIRRRGA